MPSRAARRPLSARPREEKFETGGNGGNSVDFTGNESETGGNRDGPPRVRGSRAGGVGGGAEAHSIASKQEQLFAQVLASEARPAGVPGFAVWRGCPYATRLMGTRGGK